MPICRSLRSGGGQSSAGDWAQVTQVTGFFEFMIRPPSSASVLISEGLNLASTGRRKTDAGIKVPAGFNGRLLVTVSHPYSAQDLWESLTGITWHILYFNGTLLPVVYAEVYCWESTQQAACHTRRSPRNLSTTKNHKFRF